MKVPGQSINTELPVVRMADPEYWITVEDGRIQCRLCPRTCTLRPNQQGMCRCRVFHEDKLYVITYGSLSVLEIKPIENTPFYHFFPGARTLAMGSWFCNLACIWCQNHEITRTNPPRSTDDIFYIGPKALIRQAKTNDVKGILFSYNEPSVSLFEYVKDVLPLAKQEGLFTALVTNGYFSLNALERLAALGLDAVHVDIKGCPPRINPFIGGKMETIWKFLKHAWNLNLHVEISTLTIPELTDTDTCIESIAKRISQELSPDVPLHVLRYHPFFRAELFGLTKAATKEQVLRMARKARKYLSHVYVGNIRELTRFDHTWCPSCSSLLIERNKFTVINSRLTKTSSCPNCGKVVPIIGTITPHPHENDIKGSSKTAIDHQKDDNFWMMKTRSPKSRNF